MAAQLHVTRLVTRLLSERSAERGRALALEDPSSLGTAQFQAVREALRRACEQGRLTDGVYHEILTQMELWYRAADGTNTQDLLPVLFDREEPTDEMVSNSLQRVELNPDTASLEVHKRADVGCSPPAPTLLRIASKAQAAESSAAESSAAQATAAQLPRPEFVPGATIRQRYVLEEQIGSGGSALVFRARDLRRDANDPNAHVALKVPRESLRDCENITERLKREFDQSQALPHPGIVRVFDLDCEQGTWYLTMELLQGESLSAILAALKSRHLPHREALAIISQCGEALAFAHERGVLHCDLKPGNVFVTRGKRVRILDFGVVTSSAAWDSSSAVPGNSRVAAATPCYASPDVLTGKPPNERDDVFSLACVSYEVLTGRHPFGRRSTVEARDCGLRVPRVAGLSRSEFATLQRGLDWSNQKRPASVHEFLTELGALERRTGISLGHGLAAALGATIVATVAFRAERADRGTDQLAPASPLASVATAIPMPVSGSPENATQPAADRLKAVAERPSAPRSNPAAAASAAGTTDPAPAPPRGGHISLEQANILVDERAVAAVVRVKRLDDLRGTAQVGWRVIPGSAEAGTDYAIDGPDTILFRDGHAVRVLYVPILNDTVKEGNESFGIELVSPARRGLLDPITRSTITILDED